MLLLVHNKYIDTIKNITYCFPLGPFSLFSSLQRQRLVQVLVMKSDEDLSFLERVSTIRFVSCGNGKFIKMFKNSAINSSFLNEFNIIFSFVHVKNVLYKAGMDHL